MFGSDPDGNEENGTTRDPENMNWQLLNSHCHPELVLPLSDAKHDAWCLTCGAVRSRKDRTDWRRPTYGQVDHVYVLTDGFGVGPPLGFYSSMEGAAAEKRHRVANDSEEPNQYNIKKYKLDRQSGGPGTLNAEKAATGKTEKDWADFNFGGYGCGRIGRLDWWGTRIACYVDGSYIGTSETPDEDVSMTFSTRSPDGGTRTNDLNFPVRMTSSQCRMLAAYMTYLADCAEGKRR